MTAIDTNPNVWTISLSARPQEMLAAPLAATVGWALWMLPEGLSSDGRLALIVTMLAVIGWTMTRLPDSLVAIAAALALVFTGPLSEEQFFAAMGSELVWLLIAAFVIAAVLRKSGLMEHLVARCLSRVGSFRGMAFLLAGLIASTAFFIPSTSGRAALLLPVFMALAAQMPDRRLVKPLALLFPTIILLSAGASLIGAGAHLVAVDAISRAGGPTLGYADWLFLALPVSLAQCLAATALILWLFVPADLRHARIALEKPETGLDPRQQRICFAIAALVVLWATSGVHGISIALTALAGAVLLLTKAFTAQKTKELFKGVDSELIVYLAATVLLADALIASGADKWLAAGALGFLPQELAENSAAAVIFVTGISVLAHLFVTSRSARAAVLIPAVALPVAAFGHDPLTIIMVATLGTGFCQSMMASAKPVAIYGTLETETFTPTDLTRLAMPMLPVFTVLLIAAALLIWPRQMQAPTMTIPVVETAAAQVFVAPAPEIKTDVQIEASVVPSPLAPLVSLRPMPRPDVQVAQANDTPAVATRASNGGGELGRDLRRAESDVRRSVRQLWSGLGL